MNKKKKTTEDKNLDVEIDVAIDNNERTLQVQEVCLHTYKTTPFIAHATAPYACTMYCLSTGAYRKENLIKYKFLQLVE